MGQQDVDSLSSRGELLGTLIEKSSYGYGTMGSHRYGTASNHGTWSYSPYGYGQYMSLGMLEHASMEEYQHHLNTCGTTYNSFLLWPYYYFQLSTLNLGVDGDRDRNKDESLYHLGTPSGPKLIMYL